MLPAMKPLVKSVAACYRDIMQSYEFTVSWKKKNGFHVYAHCPFCDSSFASGKSFKNIANAMMAAVKGLRMHAETYHKEEIK